jgi:hypothetical protein
MLRSAIVAIGALCLAGGAVAMFWTGWMPGAMFVFWGALLLLGTLYERVRYKALVAKSPSGMVRTSERFVDPETGKTVTVYIEPKTGERSYVED